MSDYKVKGVDSSNIFEFDYSHNLVPKSSNGTKSVYKTSNGVEYVSFESDYSPSYGFVLPSPYRLASFQVSDELISENFEYEQFQKLFDDYMSYYSNCSTRDKTVAAALFLTTQIPKLPYFYGGGHEISLDEFVGLNPKWGKIESIVYDSEDQNTGEQYPYSYDCSGFVSWAMINAGYKFKGFSECPTSSELRDMGEVRELKGIDLSQVKSGDLAWMKGHIGLVVDVDVEKDEVKIAHCSYTGKGMNITTMSTKTGKIVDDSVGSTGDNRIGNDYFTHISLFNYDD